MESREGQELMTWMKHKENLENLRVISMNRKLGTQFLNELNSSRLKHYWMYN